MEMQSTSLVGLDHDQHLEMIKLKHKTRIANSPPSRKKKGWSPSRYAVSDDAVSDAVSDRRTLETSQARAKTPPIHLRKRIRLKEGAKTLSNESQRLAWDYYLRHRPLYDEEKDQALGFDIDPTTGKIIRDPVTGQPSHSCCKRKSSVRSVGMEEFSDLGPGLALTFRFMHIGSVGFLCAFFLSSIGWIFELLNPKNSIWMNVAWVTDLVFIAAFAAFMCWLRRDMVHINDKVDGKDISASDFSVKISGLPADATASELAEYFSQFGALYTDKNPIPNMYDNDFDRTGVSIVRNDATFIGAAFALQECDDVILATNPDDKKAKQRHSSRRLLLKKNYDLLRSKKYCCSGVAFVTFMYQDGAAACRRGLRTGNFRYQDDNESKRKLLKLYRTNIHVDIAPDPNDLLWKNLQNSNCNILIRQIIIGTLSICYLFFLCILMAYFAAFARQYQALNTHPPFNLGLLAILGNVACLLTSIVLVMPIVSTYEGVHTRSSLEIITFLKLGFFQTMGVVVGSLYVFSLDEKSADMQAFSWEQLRSVGSGLPTSICAIPRFYFNSSDPTTTTTTSSPVPSGWENVYHLDPSSCYSFTLHLFGTGMGGFLIGTLIGDLLLINMIDFICPPWWIEMMSGIKKTYQSDLNKIYEGVDYKPFLRYQILLKFLMTAMFLSHIDNPRILYLWVAACFWQSFEIDRYCYVLRYRTPPFYSDKMFRTIVHGVLPIALIVRSSQMIIATNEGDYSPMIFHRYFHRSLRYNISQCFVVSNSYLISIFFFFKYVLTFSLENHFFSFFSFFFSLFLYCRYMVLCICFILPLIGSGQLKRD